MRTLLLLIALCSLSLIAVGCGLGDNQPAGQSHAQVEKMVASIWNQDKAVIKDDAQCQRDPKFEGDVAHWQCLATPVDTTEKGMITLNVLVDGDLYSVHESAF
jgi:hypothetical protein